MKNINKFLLLKRVDIPVKLIIIAILISSFSSISGLLIPLFTGSVVDSFSNQNGLNAKIIIIFILVFVLNSILNGISIYILSKIGENIIFSLRNNVIKHIIHLKINFFNKNESGNLISRITNDTFIINDFLSTKLPNLIPQFITLIGSIFMIIYMDWVMSLVTLIILPLFISIILPLGKIMRKVSISTQNENAKYTGLLSKILTQIKLVKISNTEHKEVKDSYNRLINIYSLGMKEAKVNSIIQPLSSLVIILTICVILGVGGVRVSSGSITIGTLISMIFYVIQLTSPLTSLSTIFTEYQKAVGASNRINEIQNEEIENLNIGQSINHQLINNHIHFENITFKYDDTNILQSISFTIPAKKITAIVGPSGSGKTTILNLLARFYTPNSGKISLGNYNIQNFNLSDWRKKTGYVMQDNPMIEDILIKNIFYGVHRNLNRESLIHYSKLADSYEFIHNLENGFDTNIGENGNNLSRGQKQRIDLTRNFLKEPNLLLLDEVTSNLDSESEEKIQNALTKIMNNRTTVIIAHRLSTIKKADQILFLDQGKITGKGTHLYLINHHKKYRDFVNNQNIS